MKRFNFMLVLASFSMLCITLGVVGCSNNDDGNESYPAELLGTWVSESEGEYNPAIIASTSDNLITEKFVIEKDGEMVYNISYYGENYSVPAKWYIEDGKFCYEYYDDEKMPEDVKEVICVDYKLSDNTLEFYCEGKCVMSYNRVK